jgi:hypothetical protein
MCSSTHSTSPARACTRSRARSARASGRACSPRARSSRSARASTAPARSTTGSRATPRGRSSASARIPSGSPPDAHGRAQLPVLLRVRAPPRDGAAPARARRVRGCGQGRQRGGADAARRARARARLRRGRRVPRGVDAAERDHRAHADGRGRRRRQRRKGRAEGDACAGPPPDLRCGRPRRLLEGSAALPRCLSIPADSSSQQASARPRCSRSTRP